MTELDFFWFYCRGQYNGSFKERKDQEASWTWNFRLTYISHGIDGGGTSHLTDIPCPIQTEDIAKHRGQGERTAGRQRSGRGRGRVTSAAASAPAAPSRPQAQRPTGARAHCPAPGSPTPCRGCGPPPSPAMQVNGSSNRGSPNLILAVGRGHSARTDYQILHQDQA